MAGSAARVRPHRGIGVFGVAAGIIVACLVIGGAAVAVFFAGAVMQAGVRAQATEAISQLNTPQLSRARNWDQVWPTLKFPTRGHDRLPPDVSAKHDKFENETMYHVQFRKSGITISLHTSVPGNMILPAIPPQTTTLIFTADEPSIYGKLTLLVDGRKLTYGSVLDTGSQAAFPIPTADLLDIVNAKVVEGRIGGTEFVIDQIDRSKIEQFASILKN